MSISKKALTAILIVALATSMMAPLTQVVKAQSSNSLFSMTIMAPDTTNIARKQWTQLFASNLRELGIDAQVVFLTWTGVYDRALTPAPEFVGKTYNQQGFDAVAIGWTPGLLPEPRQLYYGGDPGFFAPSGQNYYLWNNTESNNLLDTFITSTNNTEKQDVLAQWQQLYFNEIPASQIMYQQAPAIVNPTIGNLYSPTGGDGWLYFNAQPYPQLLTRADGKTQLVYCSGGEPENLNPPESNSWYDVIISANIFGGLAIAWPSLNGLADNEVPDLLTGWNHTADGMSWTFNCRQGVTWHDGQPFSADDVVFSLWALMGGDPDSQFTGYYQSVYGDKCTFTYSNGTSVVLGNGNRAGYITATDASTVILDLPILAGGKPYGYFEPYLLSFANNIIPKHIFENVNPADWKTSCLNTAGADPITIKGVTYYGPVGTGPYKWIQGSWDSTAQIVHLVRNDNYWNATALKNDGKFQIKDYYIRFITQKTAALAALKNGEVDMLDYNYQMQTDVVSGSIDPSWGRVLNLDGVGRQEFGYNMRHPVFGTGVDTPVGQANPSQAAEAARNIRIAFDYAIPRELIISNLLAGYGQSGATPMLPTQAFYNSNIAARGFDLDAARQHLQLAGYNPPGASSGVSLSGTMAFPNGTLATNYHMPLYVTTDNTTVPTSLTFVSQVTSNINATWSFTDFPIASGTYYYYLMNNATEGAAYQYITSATIVAPTPAPTATVAPTSTPGTTTTDNTIYYVIIAVVVIIVIVAVVAVAMRRKPKAETAPEAAK
jgi:ABC-type transport system substrate-binding protein